MPFFASEKICVCGQEFKLYCFTDMICVSIAVVGDNGRTLSGLHCDLWHFICRISFHPDGAAVVIFFVITMVVRGSTEEVFAHEDEFPLAILF